MSGVLERRRDRERYARELAYVSPPAMVAAATAARVAGDWRGACAAAGVDVRFSLGEVRERFGPSGVAAVEAQLAGLAPDFLRRHLPRRDGLALRANTAVLLAERSLPVARRGTPSLMVALPPTDSAAQRLTLQVVEAADLQRDFVDLPAWTWHANAVEERRRAYGVAAGRLPWHDVDGRAYPQGRNGDVSEFERLLVPVKSDELVDHFRSAGVDVDAGLGQRWNLWMLDALKDSLPGLADEAQRLAVRYGNVQVLMRVGREARVELRVRRDGRPVIADSARRAGGPIGPDRPAPLDAALLRWGALTPDELHPLVHDALFPGREQQWRPTGERSWRPLRIRCGTGWHVAEFDGASLRIPEHDDEEVRRETMLAVFGGVSAPGCIGALAAFRTGQNPMPKEVRKWRRDFFARIFHGDIVTVPTVLDPMLRDGAGRSVPESIAAAGFAPG